MLWHAAEQNLKIVANTMRLKSIWWLFKWAILLFLPWTDLSIRNFFRGWDWNPGSLKSEAFALPPVPQLRHFFSQLNESKLLWIFGSKIYFNLLLKKLVFVSFGFKSMNDFDKNNSFFKRWINPFRSREAKFSCSTHTFSLSYKSISINFVYSQLGTWSQLGI